MILALDVGNTHIVIGAIEEGEIRSTARIRTEPDATTAEYAIKLRDLLDYMKLDAPGLEGAIISSVVPQLVHALSKAVRDVCGCEPLVVGMDTNTGLEIAIDEQVAGDLIVGGVAVKEYYGFPAVIMDLGTATTITTLNRNGQFAGGAILPGVQLGLKALAENTALLPEIAISAPKTCICEKTADCMRSGAVFGTAAMLDGMIERMQAELGGECVLVATGGLARSIVSHCRHEINCDSELLLKGLWKIYSRNR